MFEQKISLWTSKSKLCERPRSTFQSIFPSSTWSTPPFTLPETNMQLAPENDGFQFQVRNLLFQWSIFRGLCYFQGKITLDPPLQALLFQGTGMKI